MDVITIKKVLIYSNLSNNSLSGSIPGSMRRLNQLTYLDLSNNQLTGPFPEWVRRLAHLELLNLGQNHFSGDIPLVISGRLKNLCLFFNSPEGRHDRLKTIRQGYNEFERTHYPWMKRSKDLFWLDSRASWSVINFSGILDGYLKAEANHLTSTVFQNIRRDPARILEFFKSARKRTSSSGYDNSRNNRRRIA
jgi:hypothetical protein